jgi:hypothetical protein
MAAKTVLLAAIKRWNQLSEEKRKSSPELQALMTQVFEYSMELKDSKSALLLVGYGVPAAKPL